MKQILHTLISFLLLANLAFTQVGVGYLHHHDGKAEKAEGYCFEEAEHDECVGCSLHIIQELFYLDRFQFTFVNVFPFDYSFERTKPAYCLSFPASGRAPPTFIA